MTALMFTNVSSAPIFCLECVHPIKRGQTMVMDGPRYYHSACYEQSSEEASDGTDLRK